MKKRVLLSVILLGLSPSLVFAEETFDSTPIAALVNARNAADYTVPESFYESQNAPSPDAAPAATSESSSSSRKKSGKGWHAKKSKPAEEPAPVVESSPAPEAQPVVTSETVSAPQPVVVESTPAPSEPAPLPESAPLPEAAAPAPEETPANTDLAGYDGGFFLKDRAGKFAMSINGRFQPRFAFNVAEDIEDQHSFILRRVFLAFSGHVLTDKLTYEMSIFPISPGASIGNGILTYSFMDEFALTAGYDTIPFGHGNTTSSGKLLFLDQALPVFKFSLGESVGLWASGTIGKVYYASGVFNGAATDLSRNANAEMAYGFSFGWNILGEYGSGDCDLANSPEPNLLYELSAGLHHEETGTQAKVYHGATSIGLKWHGFSFLTEWFARYIDPDEFTREQIDLGYMAHAGYFVIPEKFEIGLRHSALLDDINDVGINQNMTAGNIGGLDGNHIAVDVNGDSDNEYEFGAAFNYYFDGNTVKLQAMYSLVIDGIPGPDDPIYHIGAIQAQVGF